MKKSIALSVSIICLVTVFSAQIPNGGFESWTSGNPDQWGTSNSGLFQPITQVSNSHGGTSAMKMQPIVFGGNTIGPIAYVLDTGEPFPYAGRPVSLKGWYISSFPTAGNYLEITGNLLNSGNPIGVINTSITANSSVYTQFTAPITYIQSGNSDSALISIKIWSTNFGGLDPNAFVILDDLSFSTTTGTTGIAEQFSDNSHMLKLISDPALNELRIEYQNNMSGPVKLQLYDLNGKMIRTVLDQNQDAGRYRVYENLATVPEGIYFVKFESTEGSLSQKFIVVK